MGIHDPKDRELPNAHIHTPFLPNLLFDRTVSPG
jgi:hypothetical protein